MNIYKISLLLRGANEGVAKFLGYIAATDDFKAVKEYGFVSPIQNSYLGHKDGKDAWTYNADNAKNLLVKVERV